MVAPSSKRFEELYALSKNKQQINKTDKSKEDYEYEKSKDELTFKPKMYTAKPGSSASKKTSLDNDRNVQKQKERMEKARDEKERIKMITERGIPAST